MTKAEQIRLIAWRTKILQYAAESRRTVSQACRYFGISRKSSTSGSSAMPLTARPVCAIAPAHRCGRHARRQQTWAARSCIGGSSTTLAQARLPTICGVFIS
jgi:hypothetical protein